MKALIRGCANAACSGIWKFIPEKVLLSKLMKYPVVSFDIFDTLLLRRCGRPEEIFRQMEYSGAPANLLELRTGAEKNARQKTLNPEHEIDFKSIYREIEKSVGLRMAKKLSELEKQTERANLYATPYLFDVAEQLGRAGKRVIAVSDMYLPSIFLRECLEGCGYRYVKQIYVSSECGCNKRNGSLQRYVSAKEQASIIHIGDNFRADYIGSKKAGWDAIWCRKR